MSGGMGTNQKIAAMAGISSQIELMCKHVFGIEYPSDCSIKYVKTAILYNHSGGTVPDFTKQVSNYPSVHDITQIVLPGTITASNSVSSLADAVAFIICATDNKEILEYDLNGWPL